MDWDCICVGPTGSGKTLLLKSLLCSSSVDFTTSSAPTIGTSVKTIKLNEEKSVTICELGGSIAPLWPSYYSGLSKVMFVVDVSNLCQISAAGVLLYSLLAEPSLSKAKILLVLAKMDASYRQMRNEALLMLQIKRLQNEVPQAITIIQASSYSSEGLDDIKKWLLTNYKLNK